MKKRISLLLAVVMVLGSFASVFAADVPLTQHEQHAAKFLEENGILIGNSGGLLLDKELIRQDSVILLSRLLGEEDEAKNHPIADSIKKFKDLPNDNYYKRNISWAVEEGYYEGTAVNKFSPKRALRVEEYATVLMRALGHSEEDWRKNYNKAVELGILENVNVDGPEQNILRKDVAVMTYNALGIKIKGSDVTLAQSLGIIMPEEPEVKPGEAKLESVEALNSTELKVVFTEKVNKKTAENLANYYIGIGSSKVSDSSIAVTNKEGYKAELQADGRTVLIKADYPKNTIWNDVHTADNAQALKVDEKNEVVKNKLVTLQVRNIRDAQGKLLDTQEATFRSLDKTAPKLMGAEYDEKTGKYVPAQKTSIVLRSDKDAYFFFDEPVVKGESQFYLDGKNITEKVHLEEKDGRQALRIENEEVKDLGLGEYKLEIVGIRDLANNVPVGDIISGTLRVARAAETEVESKEPSVKEVKQIEEGIFKIVFNAAPADDTEIIIKDSDGKTVDEKSISKLDGKTKEVTVEFAEKLEDYKNGTTLIYVIEVSGPHGGKIKAGQSNAKADPYRKVHEFALDRVAPKVVRKVYDEETEKLLDVSFYDKTNGNIVISFADEPFNGNVILKEEKTITIEQKLENGETRIAKYKTTDKDVTKNGTLTIPVKDLKELKFDEDEKSKLLAGEYTVRLPKDLVADGKDKKLEDNEYENLFAGDVVKFEVKKDSETPEGESVPQTAQGLVKYDEDLSVITVGFVGSDIDAKTAVDASNYALGSASLKGKAKLTYQKVDDVAAQFNENAENAENANGEKGIIVRIALDHDTVKYDGNYTLDVKNVATNSGAKMLPTTVTIKDMKDNTRPSLVSATITGNKKIELLFDESIKVEDNAIRNFKVTENGVDINVVGISESKANNRMVILELANTIDYNNNKIVVKTRLDQNGNYFLTDLGGNPLNTDLEIVAKVSELLK